MSKVVLIRGSDPARSRLFAERARGRLDVATIAPTEAASVYAEACRDAVVMVMARGARLPALQLGHSPRLIQLLDCANETVDPLTLAAQGITVATVSTAVATHVAEFTVGLMVAATRFKNADKPSSRDQIVRLARNPSLLASLKGRTVGILGLGKAGKQVALLLKPTGAHLAYADIRTASQGLAASLGLRRVTSDRLLATSDIVTVHIPHGPTASPLLRPRELALIGPATTLISTSDARVTDLASLADAASRSSPVSVALDIAPASQAANKAAIEKLRSLPNAIIKSGTASDSPEADRAAVDFAMRNVERVLTGQPAQSVMDTIDFPKSGDPAFWASRMFLGRG